MTKFLFPSRSHNAVEDCGEHVEKRSSDSQKIAQEAAFYQVLPESLAIFFPKFLGAIGEDGYKIAKLPGHTVSEQLAKNVSFDVPGLLGAISMFLSSRPTIVASSERSCEWLYKQKLSDRQRAFQASDVYLKALRHNVYNYFIILYEELVQRYNTLSSAIVPCDYVAFHHGDLCLSNMFFNERLQLIDPMGYESSFCNMHDPLYDVAKISHSILGDYDRIIHGQSTIILSATVDEPFDLSITGNDAVIKREFKNWLNKNNYDYFQVRLREASLFLSMLPLHADNYMKIAAFVLRAQSILNECEGIIK